MIFYGKHLETKESADFYDIDGRAFKIENFEVFTYYKTIDSSTASAIKSIYKLNRIVVSLKSTCKKNSDDCGICFQSGKTYLVYAYRDKFTGLISTNGCTRTKEISNENFEINYSNDPDNGKEEDVELLKLFKTAGPFPVNERPETFENYYKEIYLEKTYENRKLKRWLYSLSGVLACLAIVLIWLIFKLKLSHK